MKTKFHYYLIVLFVLAFSAPKANAQTLIQYWDFNQTTPVGGNGGDSLGNVTNSLIANQVATGLTAGHIIYSRPTTLYGSSGVRDSIIDNGSQGSAIYDYSNSNDTGGTAAGNVFIRARNPSDSCEFYLYLPTTGYKNVSMEYAITTSGAGSAQYNIFSYSTDGGTAWKNLTTAMDTFNIGGVRLPDTLMVANTATIAGDWYPVQINFSSDTAVNDNPNFILRFRFAGSNSASDKKNDRYDNFAVWGTSVTAGVNELSAQSAGYSIYPNPATNVVNVISENYTGAKVITLYNVVGQIISTTKNYDKQTTINTSSLTAGVYFVEIKEVATGNKYTEKIVKE